MNRSDELDALERRKHRCMRNGLLTPSTKDLINDLLAALRESEEKNAHRVKSWKAEEEDWLAENARLREAIEKAPHTFRCVHGTPFYEKACSCWKSYALEPTKGSE